MLNSRLSACFIYSHSLNTVVFKHWKYFVHPKTITTLCDIMYSLLWVSRKIKPAFILNQVEQALQNCLKEYMVGGK